MDRRDLGGDQRAIFDERFETRRVIRARLNCTPVSRFSFRFIRARVHERDDEAIRSSIGKSRGIAIESRGICAAGLARELPRSPDDF